MIRYCGMIASCSGSMKKPISRPKSHLRPGKSNLAKVKAAIESTSSTSTVVATATMTVLSIDPKKSTVSSTCRMFSSRWEPNVIFGGLL